MFEYAVERQIAFDQICIPLVIQISTHSRLRCNYILLFSYISEDKYSLFGCVYSYERCKTRTTEKKNYTHPLKRKTKKSIEYMGKWVCIHIAMFHFKLNNVLWLIAEEFEFNFSACVSRQIFVHLTECWITTKTSYILLS